MKRGAFMSLKAFATLEYFINQHFTDLLQISPDNSLTPIALENHVTKQQEIFFLAKLTPYVYEPVKGRNIQKPTKVQLAMYLENDDLVIRFEILDMNLETLIPKEKVHGLLSVLLHQKFITISIVDAKTHRLIWFTNNISFQSVRFFYEDIFKKFGVI